MPGAQPRDAANWAQRGTDLRVSDAPENAINLNVDGRRVVSPLQGFGKMWQKTYRIRLEGASVTPADCDPGVERELRVVLATG